MARIFLDPAGRPRSGWRIAVFVILTAAVVALAHFGWRWLGLPRLRGEGVTRPWPFLAYAVVVVSGTFVVAGGLLRRLEGARLADLGLHVERALVTDTVRGTLLGALPIGLLVAASLAFGYGRIERVALDAPALANVMLPTLLAAFVLAAWEELTFRGYVFRQLVLGLHPAAAVVGTGVLFALVHGANPGASPAGLLYTAVGGVLMGWLMLRTGSLWLLIGYHFGWNATASAVFGLELSGLEEGASLFTVTLGGSAWLSGADYGFEASLPAVLAEVLVLSFALRSSGLLAAPGVREGAPPGIRT